MDDRSQSRDRQGLSLRPRAHGAWRAAVLALAFVASAAGLVVAPGSLAGFGGRIVDTGNTFASGDVLLSDTIGGTTCTSSGSTISSNSTNCATNPAPAGTLPVAGSTTAKSWTLSSPGTLLSQVKTQLTACGAQAVADSAGSNTGIAYNTVGYGASGPLGGTALSFTQASGAYVSTLKSIASPQTFSVVAEVYWPAGATGTFLSFNSSPDSTAGSVDRALWVRSNRIYWAVNPGTLTSVRSGTLSSGAWHQVVATIGSNGLRLYVDGSLAASDAGTTAAGNVTGFWHLGWGAQSTWTNGPTNSFLSGSLADVAVIPGQLTAANVATLKTPVTNTALQSAIASFGPTAQWDLDDPAATYYGGSFPGLSHSFPDSAGTNTGTGIGGVTSGAAGPVGGTAVAFDSTTGMITTATQVSNPTTFSLSAWFQTTGSGFIMQFSNSQSGTPTNWDRQIWVDPAGHVVFGVWVSPEVTLTSPGTYNDGAWHVVVATIGASGMRLYLDGSLVASNATTTPQVFDGYWRIGWGNTATWADMPASGFFNGSIGHVAVYARQLSNAEAATLWGPSTAAAYDTAVMALSPQFYWPMDEKSGGVCSMVELTIGVVTSGSSACVLPASGSACPAPTTAVLLSAWSAASVVVPGLTAGGTQTVTVTLARGTIPAGTAGLHIGGTATFVATTGGFSATLVHPIGLITL